MLKRLHTFYVKMYDRFMLFLTRHDPKPMQHVHDPIEVVDWRPASAQHCPVCVWPWMMWDAFVEQWVCPHCGTSRYPALSITEKRPVVMLLPPPQPTPLVHLDPYTGQPMRLSVAYKRKTIDLGKWIQDRPVWRDTGKPVTTGELPCVRLDDRRTG